MPATKPRRRTRKKVEPGNDATDESVFEELSTDEKKTLDETARKILEHEGRADSTVLVGLGVDLSVTLATTVGGHTLSAAMPNPIVVATALRQMFKSGEHIRQLRKLRDAPTIGCSCPFSGEGRPCEDALAYAIAQKTKRFAKATADLPSGWVPYCGGLIASGNLWRISRSVWKRIQGTKGKLRRQQAEMLYDTALGINRVAPCPMAVKIIEELFRSDCEATAWLKRKVGRRPAKDRGPAMTGFQHSSNSSLNNKCAQLAGSRSNSPNRTPDDEQRIDLLFRKLSSG